MSPTVTPPVEKQRRRLHPPTSKRGLSREARAASLRVRNWPECPKCYMSEITWASKPDCGISTMPKASPNLRHRQAHAQNKGLN